MGCRLAVLSPPYLAAFPFKFLSGADSLPLGGVVVGKGDTTIAVLAELTAAVYQWPWIVPCLVMSVKDGPLEPLLMLVTELRDRLVVVKQAFGSYNDEVALILAAVRKRNLPAAPVLAQWIARRLQSDELAAPLCSQFREAIEGIPASASVSISTFSRLFARYGRYTARDWRALARLCAHAAAGAASGGSTSPTLTLRAASHYTRKYLALSYHVMAERLGWEWVLEKALRVGRYL